MSKRIALILSVLVVLAAVVFWSFQSDRQMISLEGAKAYAIEGRPGVYMVVATIKNAGPADRITGMQSPSARAVTLMNPGYEDAPVVVPAEGSGILAMDGAHLMVMAPETELKDGDFLPLTLTFANNGDVSTRVQFAAEGGMNHNGEGVKLDAASAPRVEMSFPKGFDANGFDLTLEVESFDFVQGEDAPDGPGNEGHAHIYLNGLKLGRIYGTDYHVGGLLPGKYLLRVALNTNNHQPYQENETPVDDVMAFEIPQ